MANLTELMAYAQGKIMNCNTLTASPECQQQLFCQALPAWFAQTGILVIAAYLGISWLSGWILERHWEWLADQICPNSQNRILGYKPGLAERILGDLHYLAERRRLWHWIRERMITLMLGFILAVVVYSTIYK